MRKIISDLYDRYRVHHDMDRPILEWVGAVGFIAFPLFYLLRLTGALPPLYDDYPLRVVAAITCLGLALRRWWPAHLKRFYIGYSYLTIFYCLSFMLSYTMLQNNGGTPSVVNMVIGAILIVMLVDWRNTVVILVTGHLLSLTVFRLTEPYRPLPSEFVISAAGSILIVITGALSSLGQKRAELRRMRMVYTGLAGSIAHEMRVPFMQLQHVLHVVSSTTPIAKGDGSVSYAAEQVVEITRILQEGNDAIARGLQSITVTLQQLKPNEFDTANFKYLSAARCMQKAVDDFAYESGSDRSRVTVEASSDFIFKGEETAVLMVMFNLMKNAFHYFALKPDALLTIRIDGRRANSVTVRDGGPGIAPDVLPRLFQDFQTSGKSGGTGLGLSFCRRAMQAMGGDITCKSRLGEFTEFTLSFPKVPAEEVAALEEKTFQRVRSLLAGRRVLVVDDDAVIRATTAAKLTRMGCVVDEAQDGLQALQVMRDAPCDLVVMDISMPHMDGYEATRELRRGAVPGSENVPVLGHSSSPATTARFKGRQAGFNGFLAKPSTAFELAEAIATLMQGRQPLSGPVPAATLVGKTVLFAEDSPFSRAIIRAHLTRMGLQVIEAEHGLHVLQVVQAGARPDAIMLDMNMPGLNGVETTRALRAMPGPVAGVAILALTGNSSDEHMAAALDAGMNAFLTKPLDPQALRRELQRLLCEKDAGSARHVSQPQALAESLLNMEVIETSRRLGTLNLLPACLEEIRGHVGRLEGFVASGNLAGTCDALHSLVGISGEAGARHLHDTAKALYREVHRGQWPVAPDWLQGLKDLTFRTERMLTALQ